MPKTRFQRENLGKEDGLVGKKTIMKSVEIAKCLYLPKRFRYLSFLIIKRSQSVISLQVKTRNQEFEKLSTNEVALNIISARTLNPN